MVGTWTWPQPLRAMAIALAATLAISAVAGAEDQGGERGRINVFVSPSGEPFRAAPGQPYPVDAWFSRADANHDGVLTEDEFVADAKAFFKVVDVNGDGVIDGFEITNYEQKIAPEILPRVPGLTARDIPRLPASNPEEQRERDMQDAEDQQKQVDRSHLHGPVYSGAAVFGLIREPEPVAAADLDFDGKVKLAEFVAAARRHFAELDVDHDGRITRAELPQTPAEKLEARSGRKRHDRDKERGQDH
jgi:hypothetical protein